MNIANRITLTRISMIPIFLGILLLDIPYGNTIGAAIFAVAAGTDGIDGYLARSRKEVTNLGKFLDPLADKLLITSALIYLVEINQISAWIAIIIVAREFAVTGLRTIAVDKGIVIAASPWGKVKTVSQVIAVVILLLHEFFEALTTFPLGQVAIYTATILTVISGVEYFAKAKGVFSSD
ncbi:MAG TPA: CDP-diacylglycerol--glycerol-3-phosphate 3-phosphatidyltransferase [Clostridia bacterium]|nr:CDP-diacylglycerol--glycerol-3-phosphate 3-phosphatidyltransferase [Clostridia bacterium]